MNRTEPPAADGSADSRGLAVLGAALLVFVAVALAAAVGAAALGVADDVDGTSQARVSLSVSDQRLALTHEAGDALDVADLRVRILVAGDPLAHQPPLPFFSARGFEAGPTGPFNVASDDEWTAGQTATLTLASTNEPRIGPGDRVTVELYEGDTLVATATAAAE